MCTFSPPVVPHSCDVAKSAAQKEWKTRLREKFILLKPSTPQRPNTYSQSLWVS